MPIVFDFSDLIVRILVKFGTRRKFAKAMKMSDAQLSDRLRNKVAFRPEEIILACSPAVLNIPDEQIGRYFFTPKV